VYVSKITLNNIRCFSLAEIALSPSVTLLVGENNSGKTTVLSGLMCLQRMRLGGTSIRFGGTEGRITIDFLALAPEIFHVNEREPLAPLRNDFAQLQFTFSPSGQVQQGWLLPNGTNPSFTLIPDSQPNNYLVTYLSDRRTASFQTNVGMQYSNTAGGNLVFLPAKIDACFSSFLLRDEYEKSCRDVLGFVISTWQVDQGKMAGLEVDPIAQRRIPLENMGAGVANCLGLIVELILAKDKLFLIEELETELHPSAIRSLMRLIEASVAKGNQFVISTHSNIVVRHLGGLPKSKVVQIQRVQNSMPPESKVGEVGVEARSRLDLLASLGYDLADFELFSGWLILEESSAEAVIREYILKWFAPKLVGRLKTYAAGGTSEVEPRFIEFTRLFTFIHLEPAYKERAWVICDGEETGIDVINRLRGRFSDWPAQTFDNFSERDFERYYPTIFSEEVTRVLAITDRQKKRTAKAALCQSVLSWLNEDENRGKAELGVSAEPVITKMREIEVRMEAPRSVQ
jgi:predicted ATPase